MLSSTTGWFWTSDGDVYYKQYFTNITKEALTNEAGTDADIVGIIKSSDNNTVYAFSRNSNNDVRLFRY